MRQFNLGTFQFCTFEDTPNSRPDRPFRSTRYNKDSNAEDNGERRERPNYGERRERPNYGERRERPNYEERNNNDGERRERSNNDGERSNYDGERRINNDGQRIANFGRSSFGGDRRGNNDRYGNRGEKRTYGFKQPEQEDVPLAIVKNLQHLMLGRVIDNQANEQFKREQRVSIRRTDGKTTVDDYMLKFDDLTLPDQIKTVLANQNYSAPTPIQSVAIPQTLSGGDVINLAMTGSGKTMAFILPALLHLQSQQKSSCPRILVLAPTRELAMQIQEQFNLFKDIVYTSCVYGGQPKYLQHKRLQLKNDVIIATPGRLIDFINDGFALSTITQVILDEADRMLDMGFEPQLREILQNVRPDRQTLFFSATWPEEVQRLAKDFCQQSPSIVQMGNQGLTLNKAIKQQINIVNYNEKNQELKEIILSYQGKKVLIFCSRKSDTKDLVEQLVDMGVQATALHGDLEQRERDFRMKIFKSGEVQVLVATNLASRGLDINDIELVINYDFPESIEDYVHRIGRTGRAGKSGTAITFVERNFRKTQILHQLIKVLKDTNQEVNPKLLKMASNR